MEDLTKGWLGKMFTDKLIAWTEWEPVKVEGLGWLMYTVEDNAGSITLFVSDTALTEPTYGEGITTFKLCYYGSNGNDKGEGCLYSKSVNETYTENERFKTYDESYELLEAKLRNMI